MTNNEKKKIISNNFQNLWEDLWKKKINDIDHISEYNKSLLKYNNIIKNGIIDKNNKYTLEDVLALSKTNYHNLEWGFPKGKRNKNEKNIECAIREFNEESNLTSLQYNLLDIKPIIEDYIGTDKKKYRHIYYLGVLETDILEISKDNIFQQTEISKIQLLNHNKACNYIRPYNIERKQIVTSVYEILYHIYTNKIIL
jgi:8-oxo-dGTP pyrophosphatase MutT (NUDIX family)